MSTPRHCAVTGEVDCECGACDGDADDDARRVKIVPVNEDEDGDEPDEETPDDAA